MAARGLGKKYTGMNWCAPATRLSIYVRDALGCVYCRAGIESGARLTLDHLVPVSHGGKNSPDNLCTACLTCNSSRGNRDWKVFAKAVAQYLDYDVTASAIIAYIQETVQRPLDRKAARDMIARRGNFSSALQAVKEEAQR